MIITTIQSKQRALIVTPVNCARFVAGYMSQSSHLCILLCVRLTNTI